MGFFDTIGRGWKMSKLSMSVVKKDPELMVYVCISGFLSLGAMVAMAVPELMGQSWTKTDDGQMSPAYMAFVFLGYMGISIIVTFWNSAIVANAHIRLTGGDPKFMDGVSAAMKRFHLIVIWGVIAGTVGLLLKMLNAAAKDSKHGGAQAVAMILNIIGAAIWWMMTFFIIPHLVIEGMGVKDSLKASKTMFFKTWGENVTSGLGIGLITGLFAFLIVIVSVGLIAALGSLWWVGLIIGGIAMAILIMWSSAAEQVAVSALYLYSKTG
ncbi:MAG: DUF6159 family protein, partial [Candidatus Poseidoniaceae archaeon]|nr:DUF6159 family protein [Candidatus Poseidoniaceae archaeon]